MRRRSLLSAAPGLALAQGTPLLRIAGARDPNDRRYAFSHALVKAALAAAGQPVQLQIVPTLSLRRIAIELQLGRLDLAMLPSIDLPEGVLPLRLPIRRGLLGLRLLLARRAQAEAVAASRNLAELQSRYRLGYGADWSDVEMMRLGGFRVVTASSYSGLFQMLRAGRFDLLSRGVNEVWDEVDNPQLGGGDLVVVPRLALFYPLDDYLCTGEAGRSWLAPLRTGLERLLRDGSYERLFREHYGAVLERAQLGTRRVFELQGYSVDAATGAAYDVLQRMLSGRGP